MSQSHVTVIGNLAADPELRFTSSGKAVANFTVVTSRSVKRDDGIWDNDVDRTYWPCSVWDRLAEHVCESLQKGDAVIVVGDASMRSWEKQDGSKGSRMEINAREVAASMKRWPVVPARGNGESARSSAPISDPWSKPSREDDIPPF